MSGYFDDCTPHRQQRCAVGDLTKKLRALRLKPDANSHKTYTFYDENLSLVGPYSSEF